MIGLTVFYAVLNNNLRSMRLQRLYEEKMNKMKDEALGKLKELGNSILGNFGEKHGQHGGVCCKMSLPIYLSIYISPHPSAQRSLSISLL